MLQLTIWSLPSLIATILAGYTLRRVRGNPSVRALPPCCGYAAASCVDRRQLLGTMVTQPDLKLLVGKWRRWAAATSRSAGSASLSHGAAARADRAAVARRAGGTADDYRAAGVQQRLHA
jgi:hypothetical protein